MADFLTGATVLSERKIKQGWHDEVPNTIDEFVKRYNESTIASEMRKETEEHMEDAKALKQEVQDTRAVVQREKHKRTFKTQPQTVSFGRQIRNAVIRESQQRWADQVSFWARQGSTVAMSFVTGSLFYMIPKNTGGLFLTQGAVFLTIIYPS